MTGINGRQRLLCALLAALILAGCGVADPPPESVTSSSATVETAPLPEAAPATEDPFSYSLDSRIPAEIRRIITDNRRPVFQPFCDDIEDRVQDLLTDSFDTETDKAVAAKMQDALEHHSEGSPPATLTREQAEADVEFLFDFLKYGYCGYGYFGGDSMSGMYKSNMLKALEEVGKPISTANFQSEILVPELSSWICDNHFAIGGVGFSQFHSRRYLCLNEEALFTCENGVYHSGDGYELWSVNGHPPVSWMLPILTEGGELAWTPGAMNLAEEPVEVTLALGGRYGEAIQRKLILPPADTSYRQGLELDTAYNRYELEGVPILENRHFEAAAEDDFLDRRDPALSLLADDAPSLREEPVFILDLRGNRGGDDYYACRWLEEYAGVEGIEYYGAVVTTLMSDTVYYSTPLFPEYFQGAYREAEAEDNLPGWVETHFLEPNKTANQNVVFVLIDGFVASSGESFVALLREMENVILVGTATAGMGTMGNIRDIYLPESGVRIQCGVTLFLNPDLSPFEGIGYRPDLWVPPGEGLERILAFIRRYLRA